MSAELAERDLAEGIRGEELLSVLLLQGLVPVAGCELEHAVLLPSGEQAQQIPQVAPRLDLVELAAGQQQDEGRVGLGPLVAAQEEAVFPSDCLTAQLKLAAVVVERKPAILEEAAQGLALIERVAHGLRDRCVVEHLVLLHRAPLEESFREWLRLLRPDGLALFPRRLARARSRSNRPRM
jgi:hypothetical protein